MLRLGRHIAKHCATFRPIPPTHAKPFGQYLRMAYAFRVMFRQWHRRWNRSLNRLSKKYSVNPKMQRVAMSLVSEIFPITRTIDDHIDEFESIGALLKESKNGIS
jgi:hypothetical protein